MRTLLLARDIKGKSHPGKESPRPNVLSFASPRLAILSPSLVPLQTRHPEAPVLLRFGTAKSTSRKGGNRHVSRFTRRRKTGYLPHGPHLCPDAEPGGKASAGPPKRVRKQLWAPQAQRLHSVCLARSREWNLRPVHWWPISIPPRRAPANWGPVFHRWNPQLSNPTAGTAHRSTRYPHCRQHGHRRRDATCLTRGRALGAQSSSIHLPLEFHPCQHHHHHHHHSHVPAPRPPQR